MKRDCSLLSWFLCASVATIEHRASVWQHLGGKKRILSKCRSLFMWDIGLLCVVQCQTAGADSCEESEHSPLYEKRVPVKMATSRSTSNLSLLRMTARLGWAFHSGVCFPQDVVSEQRNNCLQRELNTRTKEDAVLVRAFCFCVKFTLQPVVSNDLPTFQLSLTMFSHQDYIFSPSLTGGSWPLITTFSWAEYPLKLHATLKKNHRIGPH